MSDALALCDLDGAVAGTETIVAGITAGQWGRPTPCTGLDVRALLNHLVTGNLLFASLVTGTPPPDRDADHLGGDPLGAFRRAATALRDAFARPGALERTYTAPFGTGPGVALVRIRITEHLGHGWDLAKATGQPAGFPADVAERALAAAREQLATRPSGGGWVPFGPEVPVPDDAPAINRLAGFLGRAVLPLRLTPEGRSVAALAPAGVRPPAIALIDDHGRLVAIACQHGALAKRVHGRPAGPGSARTRPALKPDKLSDKGQLLGAMARHFASLLVFASLLALSGPV